MSDIVGQLRAECDRHTIGYPGPRRDVADLLREAADFIDQLERELAQALAERSAAFAMSRCECGEDEACRNLASARSQARREALEEAAKVAEELPTLRPVSTAHVKATTPKDVASAIRRLAEQEG